MPTPLISTAELFALLNSPNVIVVDCRFDLANPMAGRNAYLAGHISGASYAHLDDDLSGSKSPFTGRHPLPAIDALIATFSRLGIDSSQRVIAYDADNGMFAARLWWLLRWMGHAGVAVLDGGFKAWQAADLPISTAITSSQPRMFKGEPEANWLADVTDVALRVKDSAWRVLDARAPERFRGEIEPIDTVAGHVPGARNHPFAWNLSSSGCFHDAATLSQKYQATLGDTAPDHAIAMCGSGVTACHTLLAMAIADLQGAKLYAGSWSEWIRDPSRPIARGDAN